MNEGEFEQQLKNEGFEKVYVWQDGPGVSYPNHEHSVTAAHIILDGEMTLTVNGNTHILKAGSRFDVLAGTVHEAKMGPNGCKYMIGEKSGWRKVGE